MLDSKEPYFSTIHQKSTLCQNLASVYASQSVRDIVKDQSDRSFFENSEHERSIFDDGMCTFLKTGIFDLLKVFGNC